ncbi:hypothetical protein [Candidatus Nitrosocosmicus arcticus]|nr:hypothetical protein [Candidatus Nitrosocosmicus arcticus]
MKKMKTREASRLIEELVVGGAFISFLVITAVTLGFPAKGVK